MSFSFKMQIKNTAVCLTEDLRLTANPIFGDFYFKVIKYSTLDWFMDFDKCKGLI